MKKNELERYDALIKWGVLISSVLTIVFLGIAALWENVFPEWRMVRLEYKEVLEEKAVDDRGREIAELFEIGIDQIVVPELGIMDRCVTCHAGLEDPRMADQENPFKSHPGDILSIHPVGRFGCTTCHEGQGLATESLAAHGRIAHWLEPMLEPEHLYTACAKCHDEQSLYGEGGLLARSGGDEIPSAAALLIEGRQLVSEKGCAGCHQFGGQGGNLGPDITLVGEKTVHDFDFSHFDRDEPRTEAYWLQKHFLDPAAVSPGTVMSAISSTEEEASALTAYMLSLRRHETVTAYIAPATPHEELIPPTGAELYAKMCSSCHGPEGKLANIAGIRTPSLNNVDTLAASSDDYLRYIIENGRSDTAMPAWGSEDGNLTSGEIELLVEHIRGWEPEGANIRQISSRMGDARIGEMYYQGLCANCHGTDGEGGIGNALNSTSFLSIASDEFLATTIVEGRPGTAMSSWKQLSERAVSDILAYLRSWEKEPPKFSDVRMHLALGNDVRTGEILYEGNCSQCHGYEGDGGLGPILNGRNIVPAMDDKFLFETIVRGRSGTAMPSWKRFGAADVASLISYMRSWNGGGRIELEEAPYLGNYELGEVHYKTACAACHGANGEGGVGSQLANSDFMRTVSDDLLYEWIAHGRQGSSMQGFLAEEQGVVQLEPAHIGDVIAYLRHLTSVGSPDIHRSGVGNTKTGAALFAMNCSSCHGPNGEGASGPQLNNETFLRSASDGFLAATIVLGRTGTPMQSMVHGQAGLGQIDTKLVPDIIAHMRLWDVETTERRPRVVTEKSRRAIESGRATFAQFCAGCHGTNGFGQMDGEGHFAPALNNPEFLSAASDGFLLATIARGRRNTPMRPFGVGAGGIAELGAGSISDIVSYIRSWEDDESLTEGD